jgi:hypothetical protein
MDIYGRSSTHGHDVNESITVEIAGSDIGRVVGSYRDNFYAAVLPEELGVRCA